MVNLLPPEALRRACDPNRFDFETTASLPNVQEVLGQPRAAGVADVTRAADAAAP